MLHRQSGVARLVGLGAGLVGDGTGVAVLTAVGDGGTGLGVAMRVGLGGCVEGTLVLTAVAGGLGVGTAASPIGVGGGTGASRPDEPGRTVATRRGVRVGEGVAAPA